MAALVNALDNYTPKQIGENGHVEYGWSNSIQEQILQLSFQLTRTNDIRLKELSQVLEKLLSILKCKVESGTLVEKELAKGHLSILYKMIGHTRDIISGKGEYNLSYMMIYTWNKFYPELAEFALRCFVSLDSNNGSNSKIHQYGSWKDLKYFCKYCKEQGDSENSTLIMYCVRLINEQIRKDYETMTNISLAAKWAPREKSSFGWLYHRLAIDYFGEYLATANTDDNVRRAILKCKTEYRKVLSFLNKEIDTTQIKQCGGEWSKINFDKVTSITLSKQKKAFLNIDKKGELRYPTVEDRVDCAENFNKHIEKAVRGEVEMKGKRVGLADFTKQAIDLLRYNNGNNENERNLLNSQWRDNSSQNGALGKMIAMVDVSGSMEGDPMNVAISLGIRIAEKSVIGKRVMTFSAKPTWVNLEPYTDFISQVDVVKKAEWGMNTNFHAALNLILDAIIENKMEPEDVQDMVLVILSDMQMDTGDSCNKQALYDTMKEKYEAAGIRVHGKPYKPPHILFWNLRSTSGFPTLSNQPNTSMMSGFSPVLLNLFCDQGIDALQSCTPWFLLMKSLENERYKIMEDKINYVL
jgi:Mg-chelatase subunit ChlD